MDTILRRASKEECDLLFNWANDEDVRKNSFRSEKILYQDHVKWFNNKISSDKCIIFILKFKDMLAGQVRIEIENDTAVISYSIEKNHREKGLAIIMLSLLEEEIKNINININKLIGFVKFENIASQKVFERFKYNKITHTEFLEYEKYLSNLRL